MKNVPWVLALLFAIVGIATIGDYGMNWDEPARLLRGQAFVQFLSTGSPLAHIPDRIPPNLLRPKEYITRYDFLAEEGTLPSTLPQVVQPRQAYLDVVQRVGKRLSFYQHDAWSAYFMKYDTFEAGHLPLPEILGSISNRLFYQRLGWVGDIESYHIPYVVISAIGVFVVSAFTFDLTGSGIAAIVAGLSLLLFPTYFAAAHFNFKDPQVASLFAGCIWAFWRWVIRHDNKAMILFWVFFVVSLAIKWNTIFLPFILLPWVFSIRKTPEFRIWFQPKRLLRICCVAFICGLAFLLFIWPVSWGQPIRALWDVVQFYWTIGAGDASKVQPSGFLLPFGFNVYPMLVLLAQTPEAVLVLCLFGLMGQKRNTIGILIGLWIAVPILRYSAPFVHTYGDWTQIMEVVPAIAVLAGLGFYQITTLSTKWIQYSIYAMVGILYLIVGIRCIQLHPNENAYFNFFVGGIRGANEKHLVDYFVTNGNILKAGADWINEHGEQHARIAIISGPTFALSPIWLRPDIEIAPQYFSGYDHSGEYIVSLEPAISSPFFAGKFLKQFLVPVHTIAVDGVPLLYIYKNDPEYVVEGHIHHERTSDIKKEIVSTPSGSYLSLDLGKNKSVTQIEVTHVPQHCHRTNYLPALDEVVVFRPDNPSQQYVVDDNTYGVMEKQFISPDTVHYLFPAVLARYIRVYPKSTDSCFIGGSVEAVYAI